VTTTVVVGPAPVVGASGLVDGTTVTGTAVGGSAVTGGEVTGGSVAGGAVAGSVADVGNTIVGGGGAVGTTVGGAIVVGAAVAGAIVVDGATGAVGGTLGGAEVGSMRGTVSSPWLASREFAQDTVSTLNIDNTVRVVRERRDRRGAVVARSIWSSIGHGVVARAAPPARARAARSRGRTLPRVAPPNSLRLRRAPCALACLAVVTLAASCGGDDDGPQAWINPGTEPVAGAPRTPDAGTAAGTTDEPPTSVAPDFSAMPDLSLPPGVSIGPDVSIPPGISIGPDVSIPPGISIGPDVSLPPSSAAPTTIDPADVAHAFPVDPDVNASFTPQGHANYQATDIFATAGCGTRLLAPVTGVVDEVLANTYDPAVDDPATRGGNAVAILGDDGVRYYLAHFQLIDPGVTPGTRVVAGDYLGEMGETGRAGACHVHFGLSLDCPGAADDWWVRRGVIWPDEYLESWRNGENLSPLPALEEWFAEYPNACSSIEGTPYPVS
jgi:hypothetical protein